MARMSIDDMVARDTRIDRLAKLCGWSRRETRACLEDVWALCYDRVVPYLDPEDIEVTAARDAISPPPIEGFVAALRKVGLARDATAADRVHVRKDGTKVPWPDQNWRDRVYLSGAAERVGYLLAKRSAGSEGGVKSGESRRSKTKHSFASASSESQARGNPSSSVPDPSSASAPDPVSDLEREAPASPPPPTEPPGPETLILQPSPAKPTRAPKAVKRPLPAGWAPRPQERERAARQGLDPDLTAEHFRDHHTAKGNAFCDWDAAFRNWLNQAPRFAAGTQNGQRAGPRPADPRVGRVEPPPPEAFRRGDQKL